MKRSHNKKIKQTIKTRWINRKKNSKLGTIWYESKENAYILCGLTLKGAEWRKITDEVD